MDSWARREISSIISELNSITNKLDEIARGLKTKSDFQNIGSERCAQCLESVSNQYKTVKRQLGNIN